MMVAIVITIATVTSLYSWGAFFRIGWLFISVSFQVLTKNMSELETQAHIAKLAEQAERYDDMAEVRHCSN